MKRNIAIAVLVGVTALVYANTLANGFAMDDDLYIFHNRAVAAYSFRGLFRANHASNVFRPLTFGTLAANFAIGQDHPFSYHAVNWLIECAALLLLYLLLLKLLEGVAGASTIAFFAALIFAVHPIHTEAVASIVGRSEVLAAAFLFAAWISHLYDLPIPALLCLVLALLSKESAVVFLPLVVAVDFARGKWKPISRYAGIAGITVVYLAVLWKVQGGRFGDTYIDYLDNPLVYLPPGLRMLNALRIAWKYIGLLIYPGTLSADYSYNAIPLYSNWTKLALPAIAAVAIFGLWIWAFRAKRTTWAIAGSIYLIGFATTANILIPTGTIMGERLAYLPSVGFCLIAAMLCYRLIAWNREIGWVALFVIAALLGFRTIARNSDWRNNLTIYTSAAAAEPGSAKMHAALASVEMEQGRLQDAKEQIHIALGIYPDFSDGIETAGLVESKLGNEPQAKHLLQTALDMTTEKDSQYRFKSVNLAGILAKEGDTEDALRLLNRAIEMDPPYARAYAVRAVLRYKAGDMRGGQSDAEAALRFDSTNIEYVGLLKLFLAKSH